METLFSDRITDVPQSFIREILKVALDPSVISFAGGLPNRELFPLDEIQRATQTVFKEQGRDVLQYSNSEGYLLLRQYIARRYKQKQGLNIDAENILITNGAQQGLDLIGKVLLNRGDTVLIEEPGYLGAIQAFALFRPQFLPFKLHDHGADIDSLSNHLKNHHPKLMYAVPNFQNPTGITYSDSNRKEVVEEIQKRKLYLIEDDPYGELRFSGEALPSFYQYLPEQTLLLGSFSKTIVPGFRVGWIVAPEKLHKKLLIAKQASDLHTCHFTQYIIHQYLLECDLDKHISTIIQAYGGQCQSMIESIGELFPKRVRYTKPEGGMFLWVSLPDGYRAMDLFELAVQKKVVFVPGNPFFVDKRESSSFRLNFSGADSSTIEKGITQLGSAIEKLLKM